MDIKKEAKNFAIYAHSGQRRKSDLDKPMIIHPINVANILEEYGFDDNVVAAGYLHDVVEDTNFSILDIFKLFDEDVSSLVYGASEPDKRLSWEERKGHTIDVVKNFDLRHKAVVCADKISNLEDLKISFGIKGEMDFSSFKRGFESQKWYYTEVYNSLIFGEDENHPMFKRLKELIDDIFYKENKNFIEDVIFDNMKDEYKKLNSFHYRKEELYKLKSFIDNKPYVIELCGTPRTGKTTLINNLKEFFSKYGFSVCVLDEFTISLKYKKDIYPRLKDDKKNLVCDEILNCVNNSLDDALSYNFDIVICDKSLFDRMVWVDRLYYKDEISSYEYYNYIKKYIPLIEDKIDIVIGTYTDSLTSLKRDYNSSLSLDRRNFLNIKNLDEYNNSFLNMRDLAIGIGLNFYLFDTTKKSNREVSFEVLDVILSDMRCEYLKKINDDKELIRKR